MAIAWPALLPLPTLEGYSLKPAAAVDRRPLDIGAARVYRRTRRPLIEVSAQWQLDAQQQALFDDFQVNDLGEGAQWFTITLALPAGCAAVDARFKGGVQMIPTDLGGKRWQTVATLELVDRPVMTAAQLTAALGDAGAAAWPEHKLPCPLIEVWQLTTQPATIRTAEEMPGLAQQRNRSRNAVAQASASFELQADQPALFDAFLRHRGCDGAHWISFPLVQAQGKSATDVRFTGETDWLPHGRGLWNVSAPLEIRERPV